MVDKNKCIGCGTCVAICPVGAISFDTDGKAKIDKTKCIRCGACQASCPVEAIDLDEEEK
ncbi:MAG: 4Fe-4S binding protein [Clostridia bacterium]|nr:4Fe-4S binding protein [Clostridia bacterium]